MLAALQGERRRRPLTAKDQRDPVRQAVGSTGQSARPGVARQLSELARELQADLTTEALLKRIAVAAVTEVPGARYAGITLVAGKEFSTAASAELVGRIDQAQYDAGEGPCLDAARHQETVRCDDLRAEARWPRFATRAVSLGVPSVLSIQLFAGDDSFGALNIYASNAGAFGQDSESTGILLASHAALAMNAARTEAGLLTALDSREMIGQAKGILMERYKITGIEAFGLLVASSQAMNHKLRDIAEHLVATGELQTPSR
jgi:transcriptional regulator with GAF, ATPase, and Fis domain